MVASPLGKRHSVQRAKLSDPLPEGQPEADRHNRRLDVARDRCLVIAVHLPQVMSGGIVRGMMTMQDQLGGRPRLFGMPGTLLVRENHPSLVARMPAVADDHYLGLLTVGARDAKAVPPVATETPVIETSPTIVLVVVSGTIGRREDRNRDNHSVNGASVHSLRDWP